MAQKALVVVIDEFSKAIAALAAHVPPPLIEQLHTATGDLLEGLATVAQEQAGAAALSVLNGMETISKELQAVRERLTEYDASHLHNEGMLIDLAEQSRDETDHLAVEVGVIRAAQSTTDHRLDEHIAGDETMNHIADR